MNENRNQDRSPKQQAQQKHPDEWQRDLNPDHLAGQNVVPAGARLQQGATTYIDLNEQPPQELTARGDIAAEPGNA